MKTSTQRAAKLFLLACVLVFYLPSAAAQSDWVGGIDNNWSTGGNWNGTLVTAGSLGNDLIFRNLGVSFTPVVDVPFNVNRMRIFEPPSYAISGSPITFTGASAILSVNGPTSTITNDLVLGTQTGIANTSPLTLPGSITGAGNLIAVGPARLTLSGPGFHTGTTTILAGATLAFTGTGTIITIVNDGELELGVPGGVGITDPVTGSGNVTATTDIAAGTFQHTGTTTVMAGAQLDGSIDNNALLTLDGEMNTGTSTVGSLTGIGELNLNSIGGLFTVGGDNTDSLFAGNINNFGDVSKIGTGRLTLAGTLSNGTITIGDGTLGLGNGGTEPFSIFTVVNNAALELNVVPGTGITGPVTGSGTVAVLGGITNGSFQHLGTTSVSAGARLDGTIQNSARLTLDGELNCADISVGSLAGAVTGLLNLNTIAATTFVGDDNTDSTYLGAINGPGNLTKLGSGRLTLAGSSLNIGTITVAAGTLTLGDGAGGPPTAITLVNNGALELQVVPGIGITDPVAGTGTVSVLGGLAFGTFNHTNTTSVSAGARLDGSVNNNFRLTLDGVMNTGGATVGSLVGAASGQLNINSGTFNVGADNTDTTFAGAIASPGDLNKVGTGRLTLSGTSTHVGTANVLDGTLAVSGITTSTVTVNGPGALLEVTGSIFNPVAVMQGVLAGTGTITFPVLVNTGATLAPGLSPGIINTGSITLAGNLAAEILGPTVGTQYDQVNVTGMVTLNSPTLALSGGYVSVAGNSFILINNDGVDPVTGTFAGLAEGATLAFNGVPLRISYMGGDGNDVVLSHATFTVTSSATGGNGTIAPPLQNVAHGSTTTFTVTPNAGYTAIMGGTCPLGSLVGTTYTTGAITGACNVDVTFSLNAYTVTSSVTGGNGTITPPSRNVSHGGNTTFTVTPNTGYSATMGGTCPMGSLVGTTYTTGAITGACNVDVTFTLNTYTVTATAGANGAITPPSRNVAHGSTTTFTVTPNAGFAATMGGTCPAGSVVGTTYTTGIITAACTVTAAFSATAVTSFTGPTATGTGNATASFTGGGPACTYAVAQFIPVSGHAASPPAGSAPAAVFFPHGLFDFRLTGCTPGSTIAMTITYPQALAAGTQYWKYGPEPGNATPHWYVMPSTVGANTVAFSITDGLQGDDDLAANGTIVDQGGPGVPLGPGAQQTPTMSEWMMLLMALLMMAGGWRLGSRPLPRVRRRG